MQATEEAVYQARSDEAALERLVVENETYILRTAAHARGRYITRSDDEWSVALAAFVEAVRAYDAEKGDFLPYAGMVIRRRLIDETRRNARHASEIPAAPHLFTADTVETSDLAAFRAACLKQNALRYSDDALKDELESANRLFSAYGFSFFDLAKCSPKQNSTRKGCAKAVNCMLDTPPLKKKMRLSRLLPIAALVTQTRLARKLLERYRRYIIAATEILDGDFPGLGEYLAYIRQIER